MMALAFILSFLRLQKVAADQHHPVIFGRKISSFGRSTSTAPIPLKRIRNALVENDLLTYTPSSLIEEEIKPISSGEEIVSMSIISSSSFMSFDIMTSTEEEMSMVSTFCMSMPDGSMLDVDDDHYFGETIFHYLGQCAKLELNINSCIVSTYIINFMSKYAATNNDNGSSSSSSSRTLRQQYLQLVFDINYSTIRRNLQQATDTSNNRYHDECNHPEITETELRTDMTIANDQCGRRRTGDIISLLEYEYIITTFLQLFTNVDCWVSLCDGRSNGYFFKSLIANAAQCANVVLVVNDCVYDSMLDLVLGQGRRVLAESSSSSQSLTCNDKLPSEAQVTTSIEYLLLKSKTHCTSVGVNYSSEVWDMVTSDLVTIFTSSECWDWKIDCEEHDITSSSSSEMSATFITEKKTVSSSFIMAISISLILIAYYYYRFRQLTKSDILLGQEFVLDDSCGSSSKGQMKKIINNNGGNDEESSSSLPYTTTFDDEESLAYSTTSIES